MPRTCCLWTIAPSTDALIAEWREKPQLPKLLDDRVASLDDPYQHHDQGQYQEDMNKTAQRVRADDSD